MTNSTAATETLDMIGIAAATLTGDIRDFLLDRVKTMGKPWAAMSENEQRDQIDAAKSAADSLVKQAVTLIAAEGRKVMIGDLDSVTVKDGIKAVIKISQHCEERHALMDSTGQAVLVIVADAEPFIGERGPAEANPDQGDLISNAEKLKQSNNKVTPLKK